MNQHGKKSNTIKDINYLNFNTSLGPSFNFEPEKWNYLPITLVYFHLTFYPKVVCQVAS